MSARINAFSDGASSPVGLLGVARACLLPLLALTGLFGSSMAMGQGDNYMPTGSRVGRPAPAQPADNAKMSDDAKARILVHDFSACIIRSNERRANSYMNAKAQTSEASRQLKDLISSECLWDADLTMPNRLLRGAIFRAAYLRDFDKAPLTLPEKAVDFATYVEDLKAPANIDYIIMQDFADCVVRADVAGSKAFVIATPGSKAEGDALTAVMPQLGPCFPQEAKLTVNRANLSAVLSEALYREIEAGRGAAPAVAGVVK